MYDLHMFIMWICVVIFVAVFGVMFYSIFEHRKSVGHQAAQFHENTTVEIVWTVDPVPDPAVHGVARPPRRCSTMRDTSQRRT